MDRIQAIRKNCIDAGCDESTTERICALFRKGRSEDACILLAGQRRSLIRDVHQTEQKVACLDVLQNGGN